MKKAVLQQGQTTQAIMEAHTKMPLRNVY